MKTVPTTDLHIYGEAAAVDPWPLLREIREKGPVVWHEVYNRWLITTDAALRAALGDFRRFRVEGTIEAEMFGADAFIATDDKRRHDAIRLEWAEPFRKPKVEKLRPDIVRAVDKLLDEAEDALRAGRPASMADTICRVLPTVMICQLMGLTDEMMADVMRWSDGMVANAKSQDPAEIEDALSRREAAKTALADFLSEQIVWRRKRPSDDLVSGLVNSEVGWRLPDNTLMQNLRQLLFAGNETSSKWLANIVVALAERPDLQRELRADRSLIAAANDEVMRWQGVVGLTPRKARGNFEFGGVAFKDGDDIDCQLTSAGRDPARYADPDRFDIRRPPQPNLGFGVGLHNCLGINLAKLEAEVLVDRMLDRLPPFTLAAPYAYSGIPMRGASPVIIGRDDGAR